MKRPGFSVAAAHFRSVFGDGSLKHVADKVGGKVKQNIDSGVFTNACAIRMSYVLNYAGVSVSHAPGKTVSGADGKWYLFRVVDLISLLEARLGAPDQTALKPAPSTFKGKKGVLVFEVEGWSDASGHATLWDGVTCSDHCYFPNARRASLWELT